MANGRDSKDSAKQKHWEYVSATHARMKTRLIEFPNNPSIQRWCKEEITKLEKIYPQLKR